MTKNRPPAGYLSQADYVELRASYIGGDSEFDEFMNKFMGIISDYQLGDIGASQERIDNLAKIFKAANDLREGLGNEPLWAELLRRPQDPRGQAELEELEKRYDHLIDELKLLETRGRRAEHSGRKRLHHRSSQKGRVRADLWEPVINLWRRRGQKLDYHKEGVRHVIAIAHRVLQLNEPTISSLNTVIRHLKVEPLEEPPPEVL